MLTRLCLSLLALCALLTRAPDAQAQGFGPATNASHVAVSLISARSTIAPGETFYVAIEQEIAPNWHTYWRNPGDTGLATTVTWTLPKGVRAGAIEWPTPQAIPFGPLVNYGYSGRVTLPVPMTIPADAKPGTVLTWTGDVNWLECSDICIPGSAQVSLTLPVGTAGQDSPQAQSIEAVRAEMAKPFEGAIRLMDLGAGGLQLVVKGLATPQKAYFFPYEVKSGAVIDFAKPQELVAGKDGFGLNLVKSPSFPKALASPVGGILQVGMGSAAKAYEVKAEFEAAAPSVVTATPTTPPPISPQSPSIGLWLALVLAFGGGLILNLMPCVFPILSMKALSLIQAAHHGDGRAARAHGLWYGAGVIFSFLGLGAILGALNAGGAAIGWGFQLQSPALVLVLATLMVLIGFNLLGFFEFGTGLQNMGSGQVEAGSARGSLWTGLLAVIVAAPCTAPFMGAALGFAATQPPPVAMAVFGALGAGFALPFVALTFAPALLSALPRPGAWMVRLREALAFPMFATAIWLIWVLAAQAGQAGVLAALVAVLAAGLAVWIKRHWRKPVGNFFAFGVSALGIIWASLHAQNAPPPQQAQNLGTGAWSPERVQALRDQGKTVFVNFTADWCVTCKVNEATVFSDPRVREALARDTNAYLVADWTLRDPKIAKALADHGRIGVPLYLIYTKGQPTPQILPQILTADTVLKAL
jgi:thiol:disulfide interchange protein DsbD